MELIGPDCLLPNPGEGKKWAEQGHLFLAERGAVATLTSEPQAALVLLPDSRGQLTAHGTG